MWRGDMRIFGVSVYSVEGARNTVPGISTNEEDTLDIVFNANLVYTELEGGYRLYLGNWVFDLGLDIRPYDNSRFLSFSRYEPKLSLRTGYSF